MTEPANRGLIGVPDQCDHRYGFDGGTDEYRCVKCHELAPDAPPMPATLDDLLPVAQRIADALEAQVRPAACGVKHGDSGPGCVLDDRHVGHHASGDGRLHWLDED